MSRKLLILSAACLFVACGCSSSPHYCPNCGADLTKPPQQIASAQTKPQSAAVPAVAARPAPADTSHLYQMAPAKLFESAQTAIKADGFAIDSAKDGVIRTGWRAYEGEFHVLRRWQEQSRFTATIIPDINNPVGAARLAISSETQRRSNDLASWESTGPRTEREAQVLKSLESRLGK